MSEKQGGKDDNCDTFLAPSEVPPNSFASSAYVEFFSSLLFYTKIYYIENGKCCWSQLPNLSQLIYLFLTLATDL